MPDYCKAYYAREFRKYRGWRPNLENLRADGGGSEGGASQLRDDHILFLHADSYVVTDGIQEEENVVFDEVSPDWIAFCTGTLGFEVPEDVRSIDDVDARGSGHQG